MSNKAFDIYKVPYVPGYDLLGQEESELSEEEIAAIGVALHAAIESEQKVNRVWSSYSRIESISQRL